MITDVVIRMDALADDDYRIRGSFSSSIVSCFYNAFDPQKAAVIMQYVCDSHPNRKWSSPGNSHIRMVWNSVMWIHRRDGATFKETEQISSEEITSLMHELYKRCLKYHRNKEWEKYMYPGAREALSHWLESGVRVTVVAGEFPVDYAARVLQNNAFTPAVDSSNISTLFVPLSISNNDMEYHSRIRDNKSTLFVVTEMSEGRNLYRQNLAVVTVDSSGWLAKKYFWPGYGWQVRGLLEIDIEAQHSSYFQ